MKKIAKFLLTMMILILPLMGCTNVIDSVLPLAEEDYEKDRQEDEQEAESTARTAENNEDQQAAAEAPIEESKKELTYEQLVFLKDFISDILPLNEFDDSSQDIGETVMDILLYAEYSGDEDLERDYIETEDPLGMWTTEYAEFYSMDEMAVNHYLEKKFHLDPAKIEDVVKDQDGSVLFYRYSGKYR